MNIENRDILYLIALHIDNRETFFVFAQVCKAARQVASQLKTRKDLEFHPLDITIVPIAGRHPDCEWRGTYSFGIMTRPLTDTFISITPLSRAVKLLTHQSKEALETYQKECDISPKEINCGQYLSGDIQSLIGLFRGEYEKDDLHYAKLIDIPEILAFYNTPDDDFFEHLDPNTIVMVERYNERISLPIAINRLIDELTKVKEFCSLHHID